MKKKLIRLLSALIALVALFAFAACSRGGGGGAAAARSGPEVTLVVSQHDPDASLPGQFLHQWAAAVHEASNGRIEVQVNNGGTLASGSQSLGFTRDGVIDMAWGLHAHYSGQFDLSDGLSLPYLPFKNSVHASQVAWDIWENNNILQQDPGYAGLQVILIRANADAPIITGSRRLNTAADLSGMTIRSTAAPIVNWLRELGATAQGSPITELFQLLHNGSFDGAITDWHAIRSFQLFEAARFFADEELQYNTYWFVMNKGVYDRLSPENRAVIDRFSGPGALEIMKTAWDDMKDDIIRTATAQGCEVYELPPAERQRLRAAADVSAELWRSSHGAPARDLYQAINAAIQRIN